MKIISKFFIFICLLLLPWNIQAQIESFTLQYWFNDNHSQLHHKPFTAVVNDFVDEFTEVSIPASTLPYGLNKVHCRVVDSKGKLSAIWYSYFVRGYLGSQRTVLEYWFDNDMSKTYKNIVENDTAKIEFNADIADLSVGLHTMHIRTGFENSVMTATHNVQFLKLSDAQQQTMIEYWYNDDVNNKKRLDVQNTDQFVELDLDVSKLPIGMHKLSVRGGIQPRLYTPIITSYFFKGINKYALLSLGAKIVKYRYWFDDDASTSVSGIINDVTQEITFIKIINANDLEKGKHNIKIQFQNSEGQWSEVAYGEFEKHGNKVIAIPQILSDKYDVMEDEVILFSGNNFSKYGKLKLECTGNTNFAKSEILYADKSGQFSYSFAIPKSGEYIISATDMVTGQHNIGFRVKVKSKEQMTKGDFKILQPTGIKTTYNLGQTIIISFSDVMSLDYRYTIDHAKASRNYKYQVFIDSIGGRTINDKIIEGSESLNEEVSFIAEYTPLDSGQYVARIKNLISGETIHTGVISIIERKNMSIVAAEWDFSVLDEEGNAMRNGHPKGVAADGTGRIYLTVESKWKTIKEVRVGLSDGLSGYDNTSILGRVMPATVTDKYSDEANDAQYAFTSSTTLINNKCWFWYVAPDDFVDRNPANANAGMRNVNTVFEIIYDDNTSEFQTLELEIVRPPLLLVHGLASNANSCWEEFSLLDNRLIKDDDRFVVARSIDVYPDMSFERNALGLLGVNPRTPRSTFDYPIRILRKKGYASNKLDYVCHSMGGVMLRYAVDFLPDKYYNSKNYGKGYTNKVITINTPHDGSPWPDGIEFILDMIYDNKYVKIAESLIPFVFDLNDMYQKHRNDFYKLINPLHFVRPSSVSQHRLQRIANYGQAIFGGDWQMPNILNFTLTPAMVDLGMERGIRFHKSTPIKAHMIAGDLLRGEQKWPQIGSVDFSDLEKIFERNDVLNSFLKYYSTAMETFDSFSLSESGKINFDKYPLTQGFMHEVDEINMIKNTGVKMLTTLDTWYKRIKFFAKLYNGVSFLLDSDAIVPLNSQIANSSLLHNHTVFNEGWGIMHINVVNNKKVQSKINQLLNASINDNQLFGPIPAFVGEPRNTPSSRIVSLQNASDNIESDDIKIDTSKIDILSPVSSLILHPNDILEVKLSINDTTNMDFIEVSFQGNTVRDYSRSKDYIFSFPVNGERLNQQYFLARGSFHDSLNNSTYSSFTGRIIHVTPSEPPINFKARDKFFYMNLGDTISTIYDVQFPSYNYQFSIDKNLSVKINDESLIDFDSNLGVFVAKSIGNTFAEVSYAGMNDTIYFNMINSKTIITSIENVKNNNISRNNTILIFPNPASDVLNIEIVSAVLNDKIEILDSTGRVMLSRNYENRLSLNIADLSKGIYFVKYGYHTQKFIKQ